MTRFEGISEDGNFTTDENGDVVPTYEGVNAHKRVPMSRQWDHDLTQALEANESEILPQIIDDSDYDDSPFDIAAPADDTYKEIYKRGLAAVRLALEEVNRRRHDNE